MRTKRSIKDSLKEYLNWCVGRLLLGGSRDDTVRDMVDAISDEIASGGGGVSQDQLDQTVKDITKSYGIADQTVLTSAEQYTDQKIADVVDGSPEALDTLYELAKALGDDHNFATTVMGLIGQKLPTTTFENFVANKAWTRDNLTKLSQLINNINSIKAGTRVESMDVNLASISSYLEYDLFDNNTTGTKPPGLTTGFLLTFSWDNGGWGAQIATSDGNVDGAIFLRTIKASESDKIWGPWVSLYNTANFNPDSKLNYNGFNGDLNTISTSGLYRLVSGCTNTPNSGSSQGCHIIHTNWDTNAVHQLYFEYYGSMFYRYKHGGEWSDWKRVWTEFEFNPDNYLPKTTPTINSGTVINGLSNVGNLPFLRFHIPSVNYSQFVMDENGTVHLLNGSEQTPGIYKPLKAGPIFSDNNRVWDSGNFNPANYLPLSGGSITGGLGVSGYLTVGVLRVKATSYPQISFVNTTTNRDSLLLVSGSELYWRPTAGTTTDYKIYHSGNFNPDNYLPLSGNKMITGDFQFKDGVSVRDYDSKNIIGLLNIDGDGVCVAVGNGIRKTHIVTPDDTPVYRNDSKGAYRIYDSGNLGNATTSKAGLMSAADKTKLDGLSGGRLWGESPTYIFPGDPSKLSEVDSLTTITSILGTASDFLDAFNNGRVFISKTVTFSGVQVPSDIIYSLLKSEDPDTPTVFHIIMSMVIWGHYIEITVAFENNEYQAISNTINGIIGVNNTGTTN
jgi:hypothetical protein